MYANPVLFPEISNRESWVQTIQVCDDNTGDLIDLTDGEGNAAYSVVLEIMPLPRHGYSGFDGYSPSPAYGGDYGAVVVYERLGQGDPVLGSNSVISIVDTGTINIQLPKSKVQCLRGHRTWAVFLTLNDDANDDGRQILIGRLPVFFGGLGT